MKVSELIKELNKVENKTKEVFYWHDLEYVEIGIGDEILDLNDRVLLGGDFPPETYETGYKYERR